MISDPMLEEGTPRTADEREEEMRALRSGVDQIRKTVADDVAARRLTARKTLFCEWDGQSDDGRKRGSAMNAEPSPFEGASDNRVRLADKLAHEHVRVKVAAATRARPRAVGTEGADAGAAGRIELLLRWLIRNQWGSEYRRTLKLLAWYCEVDTPAGAVCMVDWRREMGIQLQRVTLDDVTALYLAALGEAVTEQDAAEIGQITLTPGRVEELAAVLARLFPDLKPARALKAARELQAKGEAAIPEIYARVNLPEIAALRVYHDVFFPANTGDLQRARIIVKRDWLSRAEVLERAATYEWNDGFVTQLLGDKDRNEQGHEGESAFDDDIENARVVDQGGETDHREGLFEVLTAFRKATDEDGAMGIYVTTFSYFCENAARPTEVFERKHGRYPFVWFARETLTERLIDSRGVPEVFQTDQGGIKLLKDSFEDHVQVTINPPVKVPPGKPRTKLVWEPFGQIPANARENVEFMTRPAYPQAADRYWQEMRREVNEYDGRPGPDIDPALVQLAQQDRVDDFLAPLADVLLMVVQLCQQFMADEDVARITGGSGMPMARSVQEIQGKFDIQLNYDVQDLTREGVVEKAKVILENIKPLDARAVLPYERIVSQLLAQIDPNLAELIQDVQAADATEIAAARAAFVNILNGVEPAMPEGGINAPLRLQTVQQLVGERQSNPAAYPPVSPISQALLENYVKYLTFQSEQMQNADIGRIGVKPVDPRTVEVPQ